MRHTRLSIEKLERRWLLAALPNPLVNNPAADATGQDTQSESTTIAFGSTVIVGYNDSGSGAVSPQQFTGWARSTNGGASFTDMGLLPLDTDASDGITGDLGDPVLARDNVSGRIYLMTVSRAGSGVQVFRSNDGGATLGQPVNGMPGFASGSGDFLDKPWITVDNAPGAGQGTVYVVGRNFPGGGPGSLPSGVYIARSTNGGDSWSLGNAGVRLVDDQQGANVAIGTDHAVYAFWWDGSVVPNTIKMRKSTNGGTSFAPAVTVATLSGTGTNGSLALEFRTNSFPQAVVNPVNGNIYVAFNDNPAGADRCDVYITQSTNGGAAWSAPIKVNTDATTRDQFFPAPAVTPDGSRLFVGWYDRRSDPANSLIDIFGATATIAGPTLTWAPNFRITNTAFPMVFAVDGAINPTYMGDYDTASADNGSFYYSWSDNRDDSLARPTKQQNVRFARVPVNGPAGPMVIAARPTFSVVATSSVQIDFNNTMNQTSFSVADVNSFTGPGGSNLLPQVTGFTWVDADTLQVNFSTQAIDGQYAMEIGPDIRATTSSAGLDQDIDGVATEAVDDRFSFTFTLAQCLGPDGFGYEACATPFQNIDLVPGQAGVVTLLSNVDDGADFIPLGANTFSFYGTTYTGSAQLYVSTNGLISFGSPNTEFENLDLTTNPPQPTISPAWDDWTTRQAGTTSRVLYKFDTPNNQLIIEWSDVQHFISAGSTGGATFQAILKLNTGTTAGNIILNYVDLDIGANPSGVTVTMTAGIKAAGTQGANRLFIVRNEPSPYAQQGKAILITNADMHPPRITANSFEYLTGHAGQFTFSENVAAALSATDFVVQNLTTATTIPPGQLALGYAPGTNVATLTFPGAGSGGILPDGNYRVTLPTAAVSDPAGNQLDGDANGTAGPDYTFTFFVLRCDANRDRTVDSIDFNILAANFGQSGKNFGQGDFNYNGTVDTVDFNLLAAAFSKTLAPTEVPSPFIGSARGNQFGFGNLVDTEKEEHDRPDGAADILSIA